MGVRFLTVPRKSKVKKGLRFLTIPRNSTIKKVIQPTGIEPTVDAA